MVNPLGPPNLGGSLYWGCPPSFKSPSSPLCERGTKREFGNTRGLKKSFHNSLSIGKWETHPLVPSQEGIGFRLGGRNDISCLIAGLIILHLQCSSSFRQAIISSTLYNLPCPMPGHFLAVFAHASGLSTFFLQNGQVWH